MAASAQEMTAQIVALTDTNNALAARLDAAEGQIARLILAGPARGQTTGDS